MASTLGTKNPFRYRGYYYDTETGYYYLNSRYYDPVTGRFLNADGVLSGIGGNVRGYNLYAYCFNNPVMYSDPNGNWGILQLITGAYNWINNNVIKCVSDFIVNSFSIKYDVPLYNQGSTSLCWAYSQAMYEDFNAGINRSPEEADARAKEIAISKHGEEDWDKGSKPDNLTNINTTSMLGLFFELKTHGPLYASYELYKDSQRETGHAVIVTGVNLISGRVYTNNPWNYYGDQSHSEFLTRFVGTSESGWKLDSCYYFN